MHDHERDPADPATSPTGPQTGSAEPSTTDAAAEPIPDRRTFLNHLSRDAVSTAGRVAGLSSVLRRSVFAAGEAMVGALDPDSARSVETVDAVAAPQPADRPADTPAPSPDTPVEPPKASPPPRASADPVTALTPEQHAFLAGQPSIVLAANDPAGPPHLTVSAYDWDGAAFSLPAQQFTLRASNVESDPRVSLFLDASGMSVAMTGVATVVYGDAIGATMLRILAQDASADVASADWEELRASGDRMIIEVRPTRFVWRRS